MAQSQMSRGSSWLARECGSLAHCCTLHSNPQLVPTIHSSITPVQPRVQQPARHLSKQQLHASTAVCRAVAPLEFKDATEARLCMLYDFVHHHGRLPELQEQHNNVAVGTWSEECRIQHRDQQLEPGLAKALETIPGWNWKVRSTISATEVEQTVQLLQQYHKEHGRMPRKRMRSDYRTKGGPDGLAATAAVLRMWDLRKRGLLTRQQMRKLETSIPSWKWDSRVRAPALEELLQSLKKFTEQHGRLPKLHEKLPDGFHIGEWCSERRSEYNKGDIPLDVAEAIATTVPGWTWNLMDAAFWEGLEVLKQFVAVHGRMPTQREQFEGIRVGAWTNKQRLRYKQGVLPLDRIAALEAIDGWWWSSEDMPVE